MKSPDSDSGAPERFWTAKEWSERTRVPYRTILAAAARGELAAFRPSRGRSGVILISEPSWQAWVESSPLRVTVHDRTVPVGHPLSDLAIGGR